MMMKSRYEWKSRISRIISDAAGCRSLPPGVGAPTGVAQAPFASVATAAAADAIKASLRAVEVKKAETADRPAGRAVYVAFDSNSEPNAVTNKQIRLENDRYLFAKGGKIASVTLSAPKGADNADQWLMMSKSFQWK